MGGHPGDAYEHDYFDDPFISFSAEIISLADEILKDNNGAQQVKEDFKLKAKKIGGKILTAGARIGVKALSLGVIENSDIDLFQDIKEDIANGASKVVGNIFDNYLSSKNQVSEFREKLSNLGHAIKESQGFPLLIIIDELDRCRPNFALELLERIKHLYTTDCVNFILLANMKQLEEYVHKIYGNGVDARNYLYKFITFSTSLPKDSQRYDNNYGKYLRLLLNHYGINSQLAYNGLIGHLFEHYKFSLREMEQCITILTVYCTQKIPDFENINDIVCFLAILLIRFPRIFNSLGEKTISYEELANVTNLEKISCEKKLKDSFLNLVKYLLLTEGEYKKLGATDELKRFDGILSGPYMTRENIIPYYSSELVRFKMRK